MGFRNDFALEFMKTSDYVVIKMCEKSEKLASLWNYEQIRQNLKKLANAQFPNSADVFFFGSRIMGLATDESDLDIYVQITGTEDKVKYNKIASAVEVNNAWQVKAKVDATVPIIICVFLPMELNCDISVISGLGVKNSQLIAHLFTIQSEAVFLYHYIRKWMEVQGFDSLKGYTITLLVIYYLQTMSLMPTVEAVQAGVYPKVTFGGKNSTFLLTNGS